jgi:hypothetical protein
MSLRSNSLRSTERKLFSISMLIFMTNKLYNNIWLVAHAIHTVFLFIFFFLIRIYYTLWYLLQS